MNKFITFILFVILWANFSLASNAVIYHNELEPVIKGEKAHLELNIVSIDSDIYEARVFYRAKGDADYQSQLMKDQGYTLYSDLDTRQITSGQVEYYFAMQTITGNIITYPQFDPSENPLSFNLVATSASVAFQNTEEIILLSPEANEVVPQDELLIALSIPNTEAEIDHAQTRLLIDGINLSSLLEREGNAYILSSNTMRTGSHNAEFKIFGQGGNLLGKLEWTFRITTGSEDAAGFRQRTNVFLDNRFQNISENDNNYFRVGAVWDAAYEGWDFRLKVLSSTDEGFSGQDANRFGTLVAYNFTQTMRLYLKGGDFSGDYDPLSFWNRRIFGVGFGFNSPWFDLDVSSGSTANAVEGTLNADSTISPGIFDESFLAIRPVFNFGKHVSWGLNLLNGKEDPKSITYGANPKETLVVGTTLKLNFDNNRVRFAGSVQAGVNNNDASDPADFDDIADKFNISGSDRDLGEQVTDILESTGFMTVSQGLAPFPNIAMQFDTYLSYFNNYFKISYKNIDANYRTPGNPYLVNGIRGIFITDNIRLLQNQLFLNLYFKSYEDNLSQEDNVTSNSDIGASLSYFPIQSLPGVTLSYGTQSRKNDFDLDSLYYNPSVHEFYPEDNSTQRISLSSNYSFNTGDVINTVTLSVSNIERDDKIITNAAGSLFSNNSKFNIISLGLRNKFDVPLTSRVGFSQSTSTLGEGGSTKTESTIMRYYGGADYIVKKFAADMDFKPFVNFALSQLENPDYKRINYTAGFYVNSYDYGNLSLRLDYIDFGTRPNTDWQDMIISTRYDVTF